MSLIGKFLRLMLPEFLHRRDESQRRRGLGIDFLTDRLDLDAVGGTLEHREDSSVERRVANISSYIPGRRAGRPIFRLALNAVSGSQVIGEAEELKDGDRLQLGLGLGLGRS